MTDDTLVNGLKAIFGTSAQGSAPASSALIPYMDASGNPVGLSSMANLASVLGALQIIEDTSQGRQARNVLSYLLEGLYGLQTIQNSSSTTVTIPADQRANRCALLIIGCNTRVPSMFMLSRDAVWNTVFEGNAISASDLTVNADDSITVTKPAGLSIYYRMIVMEW